MDFVKQIFEAFATDCVPEALACLRNKNTTSPELSDVELFTALPMNDMWEDAGLPSVYFYLRKNKYLMIPSSWESAICSFDTELDSKVNCHGDLREEYNSLLMGRMLQQSSKYGQEEAEPTEVASTPRRPPESKEVGELKCSPKVLEMGKTAEGREQLRKLLLDHGSFEKIEGVLEKWHIQKKNSAETGGLVTKEWLIAKRTMADNAFEWARRNGKLFTSEIHGAEEADIPLDWTWTTSKESGQKTKFASSFSMDDPDCALLDGSNEDLGKYEASKAPDKTSHAVATAQAGASFKMCFPSLQQNASPLGLLSSYICVLGKKIDLAESVKYNAIYIRSPSYLRLCTNLDNCLKDLNNCYQKLVDVQANAATTGDEKELTRCFGEGLLAHVDL
ncbi:unnamed protein product [Symbiodinium necroappetens]|uniref:Uncharacterized protein n=1 Tax=Symbiodinium necroappetens TaxID=1628268 RepID=A0A812L6M4_9DINO|nr:unnamed protein product [Symbiodinium necroappetens]